MSDEPDNPPAFPSMTKELRQAIYGDEAYQFPVTCGGMTLRDYFAAHAPIAVKDAEAALADAGRKEVTYGVVLIWLSQMRYSYADAMLKARAA